MKPELNLKRLVALVTALYREWSDSSKEGRVEMLDGWRAMWWVANYLRGGEGWFDDCRTGDLWETCPEDARFSLSESGTGTKVYGYGQLETKIKKAVAILDGGEGESGTVMRYAQEALKILLSEEGDDARQEDTCSICGNRNCCDTCATTGLLCPIRNNDEFTFPCPHWKAASESGE